MLEKNTQDWFDTSSLQSDMDEISKQVQNNGFYCLEGAVNASFLMSLQENVQNLIKIFGKRYFSLTNWLKSSKKLILVGCSTTFFVALLVRVCNLLS